MPAPRHTIVGGLAAFAVVAATLAGAQPAFAAGDLSTVRINEVESNGGTPVDWIELTNIGSEPVDLSGAILKDNDDSHAVVIPATTTLAPGAFLALDVDVAGGYGLGGADSARLFAPDGTTLIDSYSWTAHAAVTYGRVPDGTGAFQATTTSTKGAANVTPPSGGDDEPPVVPGDVVINEVESNGDDTDWVELYNTGAAAVDLTGYLFIDNDASHAPGYPLPAGSVIQPGGFFVIDQLATTHPGFDFGLGAPDSANLLTPDGATIVATYSWTAHAATTYGRNPDGTGAFATTTKSTKGAANDFSSTIRINEVESNGGTPVDWIELTNTGTSPVDVSGWILKDNDDSHGLAIPAGTTIAAGGFAAVDVDVAGGFGLGGEDSARLYLPGGTVLVDSYSWTAHAATTYGRNPDGTGAFEETQAPTKGAANLFAGTVVASPWPGGTTVTAVDPEGLIEGDLSGLDFEAGATVAADVLWAVNNGDGLLYKFTKVGAEWVPTTTYTLHYGDGSGIPDSEGVTYAAGGSAAGIYVSTERNNSASSVSRPAVLKFLPSGPSGSLSAVADWNLAPDFPGLGANSGLEGITWIPDSYLTGHGFADARTGAAYQPSSYPLHGTGLFFVAVEGTAKVYAYALNSDGSFLRIATVDTPFPQVAEVQFDAERGTLWVVTDEVNEGITGEFAIADGGFAPESIYARPAGAANYANEGFAIVPDSRGTAGLKSVFYADDAATDGHSLRVGTIEYTEPPAPQYPAWSATTVYLGGERVTYQGRVYLAQWWTSGQAPSGSSTGPWAEVGADVVTPAGTFSAWTSSWTYVGGETVAYGGKAWRAQWWTRGEIPGSNPWGAWAEVAPAAPSGYPAWGATTIYTGGETVSYNGRLYRAQWWTRGEVPGSNPWGAWKLVG